MDAGAEGGYSIRGQTMRAIYALLAIFMLAGCAGLNVQWTAVATYNTPAVTTATMTPGKEAQKP